MKMETAFAVLGGLAAATLVALGLRVGIEALSRAADEAEADLFAEEEDDLMIPLSELEKMEEDPALDLEYLRILAALTDAQKPKRSWEMVIVDEPIIRMTDAYLPWFTPVESPVVRLSRTSFAGSECS